MLKYVRPSQLVRRSRREDRYEKRVSNWISPWDYEEEIDAGLVMIPFGKAAQSGVSGVGSGPDAIREAFLVNTTYSPDFDVDLRDLRVRDVGDVVLHMTDILRCHQNMEEAVVELYGLGQRFLPIFIGGDHSITCPLVKGYCKSHPEQRVGIVHFDAHNDVRNFEDGGPTNGTPFRGILEGGINVEGKNLVQIGIHGFMNSSTYKCWCEERGVTIYTMRMVRQRGIEAIMQDAIPRAAQGTDALYVSVDIDVLAQSAAPGTGASSPEGMEPWDLLEALFLLGQHPMVVAMDLVCVDPLRDLREFTTRVSTSIILTFLAGYFLRVKGTKGY